MNKTVKMKTPISYYGGKQSMLKYILPLIPEHEVYVEPFFGGGAVFFAKETKKVEVINDNNGMVMNFYHQLKTNFDELKRMIDATPYSRQVYKQAIVVYENPYVFKPVVKAWAFWVGTIQGFSNKIGSWRSSNSRHKEPLMVHNKKLSFTQGLSDRLDLTQIECMDAAKLIQKLDTPDSFFYVDPPYVDSNQGHYGGYTQAHFTELLDILSAVKGKLLLSSYPNELLLEYRQKHHWNNNDKNMHLSASNTNKRKIECLTFNYSLN